MNEETNKTLEASFRRFPGLMAGPVDRAEVEEAFSQVGFSLPEDYLSYVAKYGGAIIGPYRVYGLRSAPSMGPKPMTALEITQRFHKQRWPGTEGWLVISTDHAGNPVGIAADGTIWISDHDNGQVSVIAATFEEFVRQWCLSLPAHPSSD